MELKGVKNKGASVVTATERYRKLGLEKNMIVVEDLGEYIHCLDASDENSAVYSWDRIDTRLKKSMIVLRSLSLINFKKGLITISSQIADAP